MKPKELLSLVYMQIHWEKQEIYFFQKKETRTIFFSQKSERGSLELLRGEGFEREIFGISQRRL